MRISRLLNIPSKNIIRWCKNGAKRKSGAGRKVLDPVMEQNIKDYICTSFELGSSVPI
jgi:hypothetical protein